MPQDQTTTATQRPGPEDQREALQRSEREAAERVDVVAPRAAGVSRTIAQTTLRYACYRRGHAPRPSGSFQR